jgi:hypothetical protein
MAPQPPRITAVVVSHNEAGKLRTCLPRLRWCDQLIVVNLASTDDTATVASQHADLVLDHPHCPIVEPVRCFAAEHATSPWLLFVDPDELVPAVLIDDIRQAVHDHPASGIIRLPWQFYFKGRRLDGTVWGGAHRSKRFLVHRFRCELNGLSQRGCELLPGFVETSVLPRPGNHIRHEWIDSWHQLFEKHIRLAWHEGPALAERGQRCEWRTLLVEPIKAFKYSLIDREGWREGRRGLMLSVVYSGYLALAAVSHWRHHRVTSATGSCGTTAAGESASDERLAA